MLYEVITLDTLWKFIQTVGRVDYDETRLVHMHPRTEGWIETLKLRAEGDPVKKGELLGELYSPGSSPAAAAAPGPTRGALAVVNVSAPRITSYNVCYTKLLR